MSLFFCLPRDTSPRNTPRRRSECGSSLPPDCFVPRGSISTCKYYLTWVFTGRVVSTSPNPQAGGPALVGCPRLLIQFIRSYPPYRRPFLHPQPEDAPCRGDRDPLTMEFDRSCFKIWAYTRNVICMYCAFASKFSCSLEYSVAFRLVFIFNLILKYS
jgi:hypothetical protein